MSKRYIGLYAAAVRAAGSSQQTGKHLAYVALPDFKQVANERRQHPRVEVLNPAKIVLPDREEPMTCVVVDWSLGGARLCPYDPHGCPDAFALYTQDGVETRCKVVWWRGGELGVRFLRNN
jgi:PilZ domain